MLLGRNAECIPTCTGTHSQSRHLRVASTKENLDSLILAENDEYPPKLLDTPFFPVKISFRSVLLHEHRSSIRSVRLVHVRQSRPKGEIRSMKRWKAENKTSYIRLPLQGGFKRGERKRGWEWRRERYIQSGTTGRPSVFQSAPYSNSPSRHSHNRRIIPGCEQTGPQIRRYLPLPSDSGRTCKHYFSLCPSIHLVNGNMSQTVKVRTELFINRTEEVNGRYLDPIVDPPKTWPTGSI